MWALKIRGDTHKATCEFDYSITAGVSMCVCVYGNYVKCDAMIVSLESEIFGQNYCLHSNELDWSYDAIQRCTCCNDFFGIQIKVLSYNSAAKMDCDVFNSFNQQMDGTYCTGDSFWFSLLYFYSLEDHCTMYNQLF